MTFDLVVLGALLFFGFLGAWVGAARQVAQLAGLVLAYLCARPLGTALAPHLAGALGTPMVVAIVLSTVGVFLVVLFAARYALTHFFRGLLTGRDPEDRRLDGALGFVLATVKVGAIIYVVLSALTFVEENIQVGGKRLRWSDRDSIAVAAARRHNLFELTQFSSVRDLVAVAQAQSDPDRRGKLATDPAYRSLQDDPRFKKALADRSLAKAFREGDYRALLRNDAVLQLIRDPEIAGRLGAAAGQTQ